MDICIARDLIRYHRYAAHNTRDSFRTLYWVVDTTKHDIRLKPYEVTLVGLDILSELLSRVLARKTVGVVAVGQQQHFHIHSLGK